MNHSRKQQFERRKQQILQTAEQLLLDSGNYDLTLDNLAQHLDLAKGTLYKHFASKDELLMYILIDYEKRMYAVNAIDDGAAAGVARMVLQQLFRPQRAMMFNHLEEKLASTASGLNRLFAELYQVRRKRMKRISAIAEVYLQEQNSTMSTRDYLAAIWAVGQGGAGLLNSSFYQRYLGRRDTLKYALVHQMLSLPKMYVDKTKSVETTQDLRPPKTHIRQPKLIKPLLPPLL